jgi:hypothetical protein
VAVARYPPFWPRWPSPRPSSSGVHNALICSVSLRGYAVASSHAEMRAFHSRIHMRFSECHQLLRRPSVQPRRCCRGDAERRFSAAHTRRSHVADVKQIRQFCAVKSDGHLPHRGRSGCCPAGWPVMGKHDDWEASHHARWESIRVLIIQSVKIVSIVKPCRKQSISQFGSGVRQAKLTGSYS